MIYKMINTQTNKELFTADIEVGLSSVFCKKVFYVDYKETGIPENTSKEDLPYYISELLENRCAAPISYEYDNYALKVLQLEDKRSWFGRMNTYCAAVGLLTGFTKEGDFIKGAPVHDEIVSFSAYDRSLYRIYPLKKGDFVCC